MLLRSRLFTFQLSSLLSSSSISLQRTTKSFNLSFSTAASSSSKTQGNRTGSSSASSRSPTSDAAKFVRQVLFVPPGVEPDKVTEDMVLPGSNIAIGPYAGHSKIQEVEFVKSSNKPKDCPRDNRPEFAILGRSNVGKSSLINALSRKKEVALTSKKPGKTQLINHFLVNRSWYIVDLPGYGFANVSESARMDWSSFTKGLQ